MHTAANDSYTSFRIPPQHLSGSLLSGGPERCVDVDQLSCASFFFHGDSGSASENLARGKSFRRSNQELPCTPAEGTGHETEHGSGSKGNKERDSM